MHWIGGLMGCGSFLNMTVKRRLQLSPPTSMPCGHSVQLVAIVVTVFVIIWPVIVTCHLFGCLPKPTVFFITAVNIKQRFYRTKLLHSAQ
jgi:hypothetical protein